MGRHVPQLRPDQPASPAAEGSARIGQVRPPGLSRVGALEPVRVVSGAYMVRRYGLDSPDIPFRQFTIPLIPTQASVDFRSRQRLEPARGGTLVREILPRESQPTTFSQARRLCGAGLHSWRGQQDRPLSPSSRRGAAAEALRMGTPAGAWSYETSGPSSEQTPRSFPACSASARHSSCPRSWGSPWPWPPRHPPAPRSSSTTAASIPPRLPSCTVILRSRRQAFRPGTTSPSDRRRPSTRSAGPATISSPR